MLNNMLLKMEPRPWVHIDVAARKHHKGQENIF